MKSKIFIAFFILATIGSIRADEITDLAKWQAEKILSYLQSETYVIPYCDCCDNSSLQIVEIETVSIEPTQDNLYQVRIKGKVIATFSTDNLGNLENPKTSSKYFNEIISVNYTFIPQNNKAIPIAIALRIGDVNGSKVTTCQQFVDIPNSDLPVFINNGKYLDWYKKHVEVLNYNDLLVGSWNLIFMQNKYGESITDNIPLWRFNFKASNLYFTNIGDGSTGKWRIVNNELILLDDETNLSTKHPFYLDNNDLQLKISDKEKGFFVVHFLKQ
jgi:hypothetical protein